MRRSANAILFGIRLYTEFYLSGEECSRLIQDVMKTNVSGRSVLYWVQKLTSYFQKISKLYKPLYLRIWYMDEMFLNRKASRKRTGEQGCLFNVYDEHRQVTSTFLSSHRDSKAMIKTLKMAIDEAGFQPHLVKFLKIDKSKVRGIDIYFQI